MVVAGRVGGAEASGAVVVVMASGVVVDVDVGAGAGADVVAVVAVVADPSVTRGALVVIGGSLDELSAAPVHAAQPIASAASTTARVRNTDTASRTRPWATVKPMPLTAAAPDLVARRWSEIVPVLHDYIAIPNVSETFDPDWRANGHMQRAVDLIVDWCRSRPIDGMTVDVHEIEGRSPLVVIEVAPFGDAPRRRHGRAVRPPRQAAGDGGLAGWPRPVDAGARG